MDGWQVLTPHARQLLAQHPLHGPTYKSGDKVWRPAEPQPCAGEGGGTAIRQSAQVRGLRTQQLPHTPARAHLLGHDTVDAVAHRARRLERCQVRVVADGRVSVQPPDRCRAVLDGGTRLQHGAAPRAEHGLAKAACSTPHADDDPWFCSSSTCMQVPRASCTGGRRILRFGRWPWRSTCGACITAPWPGPARTTTHGSAAGLPLPPAARRAPPKPGR